MSAKFDFGALKQGFVRTWPCSVKVPQDGGTIAVQEMEVRFRLLSKEETEEALAKDDPWAFQKAYLVEIPGQEPLRDAEGADTPFLLQLLGVPWTRNAIAEGYAQFVSGSPAKN